MYSIKALLYLLTRPTGYRRRVLCFGVGRWGVVVKVVGVSERERDEIQRMTQFVPVDYTKEGINGRGWDEMGV